MTWRVVARPQAQIDMIDAAEWYDTHSSGLGDQFIEEVLAVFDSLKTFPFVNCRQHPTKNIRWRHPKRFPYRVIYEVIEAEQLVIIVAVLHAARQDTTWQSRV